MTREKKAELILSLRRSGITSVRLLSAFEKVPRAHFVPASFRSHAHENRALPLGHQQTISQPSVVAIMTRALALDKHSLVLEIGTGSGYQTAILSHLARRVYTIERNLSLLRGATRVLSALHRHNVVTRWADGARGWPEQAPFSAILVTAAATVVPPALLEQLSVGGVLVMPLVEEGKEATLVRIQRLKTGGVETQRLLPVRFVPLLPGVTDGS